MSYSVVIRTKNSAATIGNCLKSIFEQELLPMEIVVVDSGSTDNTLSILKEYNVILIHYPKNLEFNYSKALNIGIAKTTSTFTLIISSHVALINKKTINYLLSELNNDNVSSVSNFRTESLLDKDSVEGVKKTRIIDITKFQGKSMYNFCAMIKKELWKKENFDEKVPRCEDQVWSFYFLKQGYSSVFLVSPKVFYRNPYYNSRKEALEIITLGQTVYPKFITSNYMVNTLLNGIKLLFSKGRFEKIQFLTFWYIFKFKFFGINNKKSVYNRKLNNK